MQEHRKSTSSSQKRLYRKIYIEVLVDEHSNLISEDIPTLLEYLFYNYER